MKQYARIDADLQACIFDRLSEYKALPALHSMLCMTTLEIFSSFPLLITVLKDDIVPEHGDVEIFREQYRRVYNIHYGIWLVIARTPEQYSFIRETLPIGNCVFVQLLDHNAPADTCAELVSDFVFRLQLDDAIDRVGAITASFRIDIAKCGECGQTYRIVSGIYLFRNHDVFDDSPEKEPKIFVPVKDFSYPLYRYACTQVNTPLRDGTYVCALCDSELAVSEADIIPDAHIRLCLTADDCLRYFLP